MLRFRHGFQRQEDQDIFSAVGGMELGADADLESLSGEVASTSGHEPYPEPSRTLFVRHINPTTGDEELLAMFKVRWYPARSLLAPALRATFLYCFSYYALLT